MPGPSFAPAPARSGAGALIGAGLLFGVVLAAAAHPEAVSSTPRPPSAPGYTDGAPPGFSGGFGESSCHACHFHADPNLPPGRVTIGGLPDAFVPGEQYPLSVTLTRPGMVLGGFQLTVRFADDGTQAGTLEAGAGEEGRIAIERSSGVEYANQRQPGTPADSDMARWMLVWRAPAQRQAVRVHVAANAADNDESAYGDYVYTATVEVTPSDPAP